MYYTYSYSKEIKRIHFEGPCDDLKKLLESKNLLVLNKTNGDYTLASYTKGKIYEYVDANSPKPIRYIIPPRQFLIKRYRKKHVTEKDYARLTYELNAGRLTVDEVMGIEEE